LGNGSVNLGEAVEAQADDAEDILREEVIDMPVVTSIKACLAIEYEPKVTGQFSMGPEMSPLPYTIFVESLVASAPLNADAGLTHKSVEPVSRRTVIFCPQTVMGVV
jgi:hypothetical protein